MVYNVGQADSIEGMGYVSMPKYVNASLSKSQYPCKYTYPELFKRPHTIKLGDNDSEENAYPQGYYNSGYYSRNNPNGFPIPTNTEIQHTVAGELTDIELLVLSIIIICIIAFFIYKIRV